MQNRLLTWILLIVLLLTLGACKSTETETVGPEAVVNETEQQEPTQITAADQAYPIETQEKPTTQVESAYPITQDDLQQLVQVWTLAESYIEGIAQEPALKTLEFNADNTFQITTAASTITGNWAANLLAFESSLGLNSSDGVFFSYQITELEADSLVLTSIQDGKSIEEHFTPANW